MGDAIDISNIEKKRTKKERLANTEKKAKEVKISKKEMQIVDIDKSIVLPQNYHLINTKELLYRFVSYYQTYKKEYESPYVFIDTETYGLNNFSDSIISISIGFGSEHYFNIPLRPFKHPNSVNIPTLPLETVVGVLKPLLEKDYDLVLANAKFDIHALYNWCGIDITHNVAWDTAIAGGLLDENHPKGLKEWYKNYTVPFLIKKGEVDEGELNKPTFKFGNMFDKIPFDSVPHKLATYYACHDVYMTHKVFEYQHYLFNHPSFKLEKVYKLFKEVEMPLIPIFTVAERNGIDVDGEFLTGIVGKELEKKMINCTKAIYDLVGDKVEVQRTKTRQSKGVKFKETYTITEDFNLSSPSQIALKLYNGILEPVEEYDMDLKKKVLKTPTDKKTLTINKGKHPVIPLILEYRGLSKLIEAFCDKLPKDIINGKIHCSYNQLVKTGRVSCSNPNLQQIPASFKLIRYAFRSKKNRLLASIDYSQQELRWLAVFTKDKTLLDIFEKGLDMHSKITCQIHGFNYDLFEQVRNYKGETQEETKQNLDHLKEWEGSAELKYAFNYSSDKLSKEVNSIQDLQPFFEGLRKKTKSVVFGVVYGITEIGLSDQIQSTRDEAKQLIEGFKSSLPMYLKWEKETHYEIMTRGFVETALGRKRRFGKIIDDAKQEDIYKKKGYHWKIERCKRQSTNSKIQGSSADQSKKAMVDLYYPNRPDGSKCYDRKEWLKKGYKSLLEKYDINISLQVHDEIIFDVPMNIPPTALNEVANIMQNTIPNDAGINFKSDIELSTYWGGKFTNQEVKGMIDGSFNWVKVLEKEVSKELGITYSMGTFAEVDNDEDD